jgi:hypothetical protein
MKRRGGEGGREYKTKNRKIKAFCFLSSTLLLAKQYKTACH